MSYEIVINIKPTGDKNYQRFQQVCYELPECIPETNVFRLAREHAESINASCRGWDAIGFHVSRGEQELLNVEL